VNGKIVQVNGNDMSWRVYSTGHRNPWRIHWDNTYNRLIEIETGWYR
jgi:hydroxyacyl-ACP dehydratase HTD2-like protein with hotdog domain